MSASLEPCGSLFPSAFSPLPVSFLPRLFPTRTFSPVQAECKECPLQSFLNCTAALGPGVNWSSLIPQSQMRLLLTGLESNPTGCAEPVFLQRRGFSLYQVGRKCRPFLPRLGSRPSETVHDQRTPARGGGAGCGCWPRLPWCPCLPEPLTDLLSPDSLVS